MNINRPRNLNDLIYICQTISNVKNNNYEYNSDVFSDSNKNNVAYTTKDSEITNSVIYNNCTIIKSRLENCLIMNGCFISDSELKDCIIFDNTTIISCFLSNKVYIENNCEILHSFVTDNVHIGVSTSIGPFSNIHTDCDINDNCHIGNFVEIKKSQILDNTKIKHLSYVGDAHLGKNVNIGAGTIFCNYDGKNKHQSHVGNNTFIGSNCTIIAPIFIGDNCMIGANSCVDNDLKENTFFVRRSSNAKYKPNKRSYCD